MPSVSKRIELPVLITLGLWGLVSAVQGAGLSMFVSGPHQYRDTFFIELVYDSIIAGVLIGLVSPRLAAGLLCAAALISVVLIYQTNAFGHGAATGQSLLWAIVLRPALAAVILFFLPSIGPLGRMLLQSRSKAGK